MNCKTAALIVKKAADKKARDGRPWTDAAGLALVSLRLGTGRKSEAAAIFADLSASARCLVPAEVVAFLGGRHSRLHADGDCLTCGVETFDKDFDQAGGVEWRCRGCGVNIDDEIFRDSIMV